MLEKIEAKLVPPRKWLSAIVDDTDDEAVVKEKQEKALASMWPAILKTRAAWLRTSTGYCG